MKPMLILRKSFRTKGGIRNVNFRVIGITGGAPEMNSILPHLIQSLSPLATSLILKSNLTLMAEANYEESIYDG